MKETHQYFIITDPQGATLNGEYVSTTYRAIIVARHGFYEMEQFAKRFTSESELVQFCQAVMAKPTGTHGRFSWQYDGDPVTVVSKR